MDDLISRQAAIDAIAGCTNCGDEEQLRKYVVKHGLENGWTGGVLDALDAIKDLPPAEPKTGKWIKHIDDLFPEESTIECDQCHEHQPLTIDDNFCPNCGAKMMEGDAE